MKFVSLGGVSFIGSMYMQVFQYDKCITYAAILVIDMNMTEYLFHDLIGTSKGTLNVFPCSISLDLYASLSGKGEQFKI